MDIAGFCGRKAAVEVFVKDLAHRVLKETLIILRDMYETTWNGEIILSQEALEFKLSDKDKEAFAKILEKGSRIHAFFATKDPERLDPDEIIKDKELSEFQDEMAEGYDHRQD